MNFNNRDIKDFILLNTNIWKLEFYIANKFKNNVNYFFQNKSVFAESLSCFFSGEIGGGSGGLGFDTINVKNKTGSEIKSTCTIQSSKCNKCNFKSLVIFRKCFNCKSSNIVMKNDSRYGILPSAHFDKIKKLENYYFLRIYDDIDIKNKIIIIKLSFFKLPARSKYLNEFLLNQKTRGGNTANLLPFSYDFYMMGACLLMESEIKINYKNTTDENLFKKFKIYNNPVPQDIPQSILKKFEIDILLKNNVKVEKYIKYDKVKKILKLRQKSLGKKRGKIISTFI